MKILFVFFVFTAINLFAQTASDYFPSTPGYKWYFKNIPLDSLNNPIDSLAIYQIDSLAGTMDYNGRTASVVLSKFGTKENIIETPYLDSAFVHTENSNIWNYINGLDAGIISFDFEGWYSLYRLASSTSSTYNIFTKDSLITIDSINYTLRIEVTGRRLTDQVISTPFGSISCKKFLLKPAVKLIPQIFPIPITIVTINDTTWIAPQHYVVKTHRPTANINLTLLGLPSFSIPGGIVEAISPPPVMALDSLLYNISAKGDTNFIVIRNEGAGLLTWNAEINSGNEWISFYSDSAGTENDTLFLAFAKNDTTLKRYGLLTIYSDEAFSAPKYISFVQEEGETLVSYNDESNTPEEYYLGQNYPNPFNPSTTIDFTVKSTGFVSLELFDILGNSVSVITEGVYSPGKYSVKFNSEGLSSGIYIYKLKVNGYSSSRKMILIK
jgi:hypothetical protein